MKKQSNLIKVLMPVVAVIVLAESLLLITNLSQKASVVVPTTVPTGSEEKVTQGAVYDITVSAIPTEMVLNKGGEVEVTAVGNANKFLDAVNVYLKYDPTAFDVTNLTFDKKLGKPSFSKVSQTTGLIVANFLVSATSGLQVAGGEELSLMKFNVKPIKTGVFTFSISTGNDGKESTTMFVENTTSKILPFLSKNLTVNVSR